MGLFQHPSKVILTLFLRIKLAFHGILDAVRESRVEALLSRNLDRLMVDLMCLLNVFCHVLQFGRGRGQVHVCEYIMTYTEYVNLVNLVQVHCTSLLPDTNARISLLIMSTNTEFAFSINECKFC